MTIVAPQNRDFDVMLGDLGQTLTLRTITRTKDSDGRITNVSTSDSTITGIVEEISAKKVDLLAGGHYNIGDIHIYIDPDHDVTIFDKIIWGSKTLGIKEIKYDQKIAGYYVFKTLHCITDEK